MNLGDCAWAAGLFEGEGTVRITAFTKTNLGALEVSVTNTDRQIVEFFHDRWGGRVKPATGLRGDQRAAWVWTISARKASAFLADVAMFFVTDRNKERALTAFVFQGAKVHRSQQGSSYVEEQWNAFMWMKELNARGNTARPFRRANPNAYDALPALCAQHRRACPNADDHRRKPR